MWVRNVLLWRSCAIISVFVKRFILRYKGTYHYYHKQQHSNLVSKDLGSNYAEILFVMFIRCYKLSKAVSKHFCLLLGGQKIGTSSWSFYTCSSPIRKSMKWFIKLYKTNFVQPLVSLCSKSFFIATMTGFNRMVPDFGLAEPGFEIRLKLVNRKSRSTISSCLISIRPSIA